MEGTPPGQPPQERVERRQRRLERGRDSREGAREAAAGIVADAGAPCGEETRGSRSTPNAERVLREAEEEAKRIRTTAQARERATPGATAQEAAPSRERAASLESGNSDLRGAETNVLASRRDRILRELESIARDLEDAIAEAAARGSPTRHSARRSTCAAAPDGRAARHPFSPPPPPFFFPTSTRAQSCAGFPAGVAVVSVDTAPGGRLALTVGSLASLSLEPPLVGIAIGREAAMHEL